MRKILTIILFSVSGTAFAQISEPDTTIVEPKKLIVHRDNRIDILGRKLAEINQAQKKITERTAMGFRLQVLSTNDREYAMRTRSTLLQKFPEQKCYMFYQSPYVKLRFGNFRTKQEAEVYKKQISRMLGGSSIYTVAEKIEVKPEKDKEVEEE